MVEPRFDLGLAPVFLFFLPALLWFVESWTGRVIEKLKGEEDRFSRESGDVWTKKEEARGNGAKWARPGPCLGRWTCVMHGGA